MHEEEAVEEEVAQDMEEHSGPLPIQKLEVRRSIQFGA